jgi:nitrite reductase (NADH) large subunit
MIVNTFAKASQGASVVPSCRTQLVIVGNGMAAGRLLDELLARAASVFDVTVIGDEPQGSYNRILLSPVLAGEIPPESVIQKSAAWYRERGIRFVAGDPVTALCPQDRKVRCRSGLTISYDQLVLATGSRPASIAAKNQQLSGIVPFRTLDDVARLLALCAGAKRALVVGGGLLGLEAAYGLARQGLAVTVVHRGRWLLNRQLDPRAGAFLAKVMQSKGIDCVLGAEVDRFLGDAQSPDVLAGARLNTGQQLACDIAVIATGITPNSELGDAAGLTGDKAIAVDDYLQTRDARISALGECCEHRGQTFGLVEPIWQQCISLAERLGADQRRPFQNVPVATKLKVSGVHLFSAGDFVTLPHHHEWVMEDATTGVYRKLLLRDGCIVGVVLFGDVRDGPYYFDLMQSQTPVLAALPGLLVGRAFAPTLATGAPESVAETAATC